MQRKFTMCFHEQGDLGADLAYKWTAPAGCTLVHVSAVQSDSDACGIIIGTSADPNGFITTYSCGVSGTPVEKEALTDFDGALAGSQYPVISDGDIVTIDVDYDYNAAAGSGNAADVTIVLTFVEGGSLTNQGPPSNPATLGTLVGLLTLPGSWAERDIIMHLTPSIDAGPAARQSCTTPARAGFNPAAIKLDRQSNITRRSWSSQRGEKHTMPIQWPGPGTRATS